MKFLSYFTTSLLLIYSISTNTLANDNTLEEITKEDLSSSTIENADDEYPYIQPIAIEKRVIADHDHDGVPDVDDQCPDSEPNAVVDESGCEPLEDMSSSEQSNAGDTACPEPIDSDGDGIIDENDQCPNTPKGTKVDAQGCPFDSDEDGVVDSKDQCPNTSKLFSVDGYGCPQIATLKANFATNSYALNEQIMDELKKYAQFLKDNIGYKVIIYGHTDSTGNEDKNKILSKNRAKSIVNGLERYGISMSRMTYVGQGSQYPIATNSTKEGRAKNRRIEAELIK